ncbi:MAG: hypothetical protein ACREMQ_06245 [Longimicrobiales bacterium]
MRIRNAVMALLVLCICAGPAAAQSWESPTFFSPVPHDDIGLYLAKAEEVDDAGWLAIWRQSGNINLGVRAGLAPGFFDWLLGAEFYGPLNLFQDSRILLSWIVAGGAMFGDGVTALRIPVGASFGANLGSGSFQIIPYVHPRVTFDLIAEDVAGQEETDTEFYVDVDLGADLQVGESLVFRAGFTLGDFTTFGAGVAYRIPRRVVVR